MAGSATATAGPSPTSSTTAPWSSAASTAGSPPASSSRRSTSPNTSTSATPSPLTHAAPEPDERTAPTVLSGVLQHSGVELSAHQTITAEQETWSSIAQLAAEYETLAAAAQRDRWLALLQRSGLTADHARAVGESTAFGPLSAALRRAEAAGYDVDRLVPTIIAGRTLADADDVAAVLHERLRLATTSGRPAGTDRLIAGLIPEAIGKMTDDMRAALDQLARLIEARARTRADEAIRTRAPWLRLLGDPPTDRRCRERWLAEITAIAAYRDRYQIDGDRPLGYPAPSEAQRTDAHLARMAQRRATELLTHRTPAGSPHAIRSIGTLQ